MEQRKKVFWVVIGVAMISLLVAVVVNKSVRRAHDGNESTAAEESPPKMDSAGHAEGSSAALHQDKTAPESPSAKVDESEHAPHESGIGQSANKDNGVSWIQAAIEYDRKGQIGDPPEGWRKDYSHWDIQYPNTSSDLEKIGLVEETGGPSYIFQPTEEARQRMGEIQREIAKAREEGLLTQEAKSGYVRRVLYGEIAVYAAPDFIEHYDALLREMKQINVRHMQETSVRGGFIISSGMSTNPEYSKVAVRYYRRGDGSLMREVTLPSGEMKTFVAGPPPDLSRYSEEAIEFMKYHWGGTEETQTSGDSHAFSISVPAVPNP